MTLPDNPYDAPIALQNPALPLRTKIFTGTVGLFVFTGAVITLGTFLFALLILIAGQTLPSPLPKTAWFDSPLQKLILGVGSVIVLSTSLALGSWVVLRIIKSQRLTAEVLFRRKELTATVGAMHIAMKEKKSNLKPQDVLSSTSNAIRCDT